MIKRLLAGLGVAAIAALGVGSGHTVYASNIGTHDCTGAYVPGTTVYSSEGGTTVSTTVGYDCEGPGPVYTLHAYVVHSSYTGNFGAYDCLGVYVNGGWVGDSCASATVIFVSGYWAGGTYYPPMWYSSERWTGSAGAGTAFGLNDQDGSSSTIVQPTGLAYEYPYAVDWNDLP